MIVQYALRLRHYTHNSSITFDGYAASTTDHAHSQRRKACNDMLFTSQMPCDMDRDVFLSNTSNKVRFIDFLVPKLRIHYTVRICDSDADLPLVMQTIESAQFSPSVGW